MAKKDDKINVSKMKEELSVKLDGLKQLHDDQKKYKNEDIKRMINYYNALTDKVEDRRIRIHSFSLQLLAISVAGLTLMISKSADINSTEFGRFLFWPGILIVVVLIVSSLISNFLYEMQSWFRYPFLEIEEYGNKWKWFYYGNKEIMKISRNPVFKSKAAEKTIIPYMKGLFNFLSNYTEENLDKEIRDNIQQLYLLQVHNYYKNRFYLQLTGIWRICFFAIVVIMIIWIVYLFTGRVCLTNILT